MKASVNGTVIAEAPQDELIKIEGNWYFPPSSVVRELLEESPTPYTCPWKGPCQYFNVTVDGQRLAGPRLDLPEPVRRCRAAGRAGLRELRRLLERGEGHRVLRLEGPRGRGAR